jgi:hypothetical protein
MIHWIRKSAWYGAGTAFFILVLLGLDPADPLDTAAVSFALIKALAGAAAVWFTAFIVADMLLKGVVEDIDPNVIDRSDEGLLRRVREERESGAARARPASRKPPPKKDAAKKRT